MSMEQKDSSNSSNGKLVMLHNENLKSMEEDHLYHLGMSTKMKHFNDIFSDIKFVCFGGSATRMERMAHKLVGELDIKIPPGQTLANISSATDRYVMYKVGCVLCVNHGIGMASTFVVLHEVIKALYYSKATDVHIFRTGTSGGLGLEPGTVVLTSEALDSCLRPYLEVPILGEMVKRESVLDKTLNENLLSCAQPHDDFKVVIGKTICSWDFYEGQGRLDGAVCNYNEEKKMAFLKKAHGVGVRNIEMEGLVFGSLCLQAGIPAAVVCVTYLDRFKGDQVATPHDTLNDWQERPFVLVSRFIKKYLQESK